MCVCIFSMIQDNNICIPYLQYFKVIIQKQKLKVVINNQTREKAGTNNMYSSRNSFDPYYQNQYSSYDMKVVLENNNERKNPFVLELVDDHTMLDIIHTLKQSNLITGPSEQYAIRDPVSYKIFSPETKVQTLRKDGVDEIVVFSLADQNNKSKKGAKMYVPPSLQSLGLSQWNSASFIEDNKLKKKKSQGFTPQISSKLKPIQEELISIIFEYKQFEDVRRFRIKARISDALEDIQKEIEENILGKRVASGLQDQDLEYRVFYEGKEFTEYRTPFYRLNATESRQLHFSIVRVFRGG